MRTLDFREYEVDGLWGDFVAAVRTGVAAAEGIVLVRNLPEVVGNARLLGLAHGLGHPHRGADHPEHPLEDGYVFRVEVRDLYDESGSPIYSTTSAALACHSDGANRENPYDVVLMHCVRPAEQGGESHLVPLSALMPRLDARAVVLLRELVYPYHCGRRAILAGEGENLWIRYNRMDIDFYRERFALRLSADHIWALAHLEDAIAGLLAEWGSLRLSAGDCLVVDNRRVLHGRSAIVDAGNRLLKRVRLWMVRLQV
jgi:hypothetical protein